MVQLIVIISGVLHIEFYLIKCQKLLRSHCNKFYSFNFSRHYDFFRKKQAHISVFHLWNIKVKIVQRNSINESINFAFQIWICHITKCQHCLRRFQLVNRWRLLIFHTILSSCYQTVSSTCQRSLKSMQGKTS